MLARICFLRLFRTIKRRQNATSDATTDTNSVNTNAVIDAKENDDDDHNSTDDPRYHGNNRQTSEYFTIIKWQT